MRLLPSLSLMALLLGSCAAPSSDELAPLSSIKPSVAREGSLANTRLTADATKAMHQLTAGRHRGKKLIKFVIQQPVGQVGSKAWREVWVLDPEGAHLKYVMTFQEDGKGSADFFIKKL